MAAPPPAESVRPGCAQLLAAARDGGKDTAAVVVAGIRGAGVLIVTGAGGSVPIW